MENPFEELNNKLDVILLEIAELKNIVKKKTDVNLKFYTRKEAADILKVSVQTVDNYIKSGVLPVFQKDKNSGRKLIKHEDLFNEDNTSKDMKYKRVDEFDLNRTVIAPTEDYPKDESGEIIIEVLKKRVKISDIMQYNQLDLSFNCIKVLSAFIFSEEYVDSINKDDFLSYDGVTIQDWNKLQELINDFKNK